MDPITIVAAQLAVQRQAPDYWNYVLAGYAAAVLAIGGFVAHTVRRGRKLSRQVPTDKRRWM